MDTPYRVIIPKLNRELDNIAAELVSTLGLRGGYYIAISDTDIPGKVLVELGIWPQEHNGISALDNIATTKAINQIARMHTEESARD
jgi:bifunctional DNA-binding transcriptional regulator/antitoxin component of YhaV-PrlF toxin-antitoxin module